MLKRILALGCGLVLAVAALGDAVHYKQVAATATAKTVNLGSSAFITIYNEGANEIYFRLFRDSEGVTDAVATAAGGVFMAAGTTLEYPTSLGPYGNLSVICSAGETSTVHIYLP